MGGVQERLDLGGFRAADLGEQRQLQPYSDDDGVAFATQTWLVTASR
jgi:hypothetical protein